MKLLSIVLVLLCTACVGTVRTPMVQVPLLRRAGQGEAGLTIAPASRSPSFGATARYAATDSLRLGGSIAGSGISSHDELRASEGTAAPRLFADGFVGAEWGGLLFRGGALAGAGYGERWMGSCPEASSCAPAQRERVVGQYVRSYGQVHFALAPPGPLVLSLAVRVPITVDLPRDERERLTRIDTEVALTHSLIFRHLRLDLQPLWARRQGFAFHMALLFRFSG